MSYDISLFSRVPGAFVEKTELTKHLVQLGWRPDRENHFLIQATDDVSADMDLAWLENGIFGEPGNQVNCLQVHIPYALLKSSQAETLKRCQEIAKALDWRIYDEQEGAYLR
ncbi:MAG: hypothetical protein LAO76_26230 [Acidobacteriia bacterium]|nr:hypothetical protein [Terriglobia bacterium]